LRLRADRAYPVSNPPPGLTGVRTAAGSIAFRA
jgi:hypothetical protein